MSHTTASVVGANVRAELARRGMSQRSLATKLQISPTGISKRLAGVTPFDVDELATIVSVLGVDVQTLFEDAA